MAVLCLTNYSGSIRVSLKYKQISEQFVHSQERTLLQRSRKPVKRAWKKYIERMPWRKSFWRLKTAFGNDSREFSPSPSHDGVLETARSVRFLFFAMSTRLPHGVYIYDGFTTRRSDRACSPRNRRLKKKIAEHLSFRLKDRWEFASRGCNEPRKTPCARALFPLSASEWAIVTFMPRNYTFLWPSGL